MWTARFLVLQKSDQEYQDAVQLLALYESSKADLIAAAFGESTADDRAAHAAAVDPTVQDKCKRLLDSVKKLKNGDRVLCEFFMTLPDKKVRMDTD